MCTHLDKTGSTYYFRRAVPDDLIGHFTTATGKARTEWKFSLRTKDREEAKRRLRPHTTGTDTLIDETRLALRDGNSAMPSLVEPLAVEREREEKAAQDALRNASSVRRAGRSEARTLVRQRLVMSTAELSPEDAAVVDLINERDVEIGALREALSALRAGNDELRIARTSMPIPYAARGTTPHTVANTAISLTALFAEYAASGAATAHTVAKWRAAVSAFVQHLGHDDASEVTRSDVTGWFKALVDSGLAVRTVTGTYRAAIARVLKLAHTDGHILENVSLGIEVRGPKPTKVHRSDLSDAEAKLILTASLQPQPGGVSRHHALARRWGPWISAYTGARIAEIMQMRACDMRREEGTWVFRFTPEAGSIKNSSLRLVPIHSHLIEQGILALAEGGAQTPLFYDFAASRRLDTVQKQPQQMGSKLAKWVRELGVTEVASPNHGWRHRFKTVARSVGIPAEVRDAIQGHATRTEGEKYGSQPVSVLREAIERLPRYGIGPLAK